MPLVNYATETMTCVGRYTGSTLLLNGNNFHYAVYRDGTAGELYVVVNWASDSVNYTLYDRIWLMVGTSAYNFSIRTGWDDPVAAIPLPDGQTTIQLHRRYSSDNLYYQGIKNSPVSMPVGSYTVLPQVSFSPAIYGSYTHYLAWMITAGEGRVGWGTGAELWYRTPGTTAFTVSAVFAESKTNGCSMVTDGTVMGKEACVALEYRTFAPDWDGTDIEKFVTLNRYVTPLQTVTRDAAVPIPLSVITMSMPLEGGAVTVSWTEEEDPLNTASAYELEREVITDGQSTGYIRLYSGSSLFFRDTLPARLDSVRYRVRMVTGTGGSSAWTDTGLQEAVKSNLYVGTGGSWKRVSALWIGSRKASPMAVLGKKPS